MRADEIARRVERERLSHTENDVLAANRKLRSKFAHIDRYPSKRRLYRVVEDYVRDLSGKVILDYGCGTGDSMVKYLGAHAEKVYGMDISDKYIAICRKLCLERAFPPERYDLRVMDAHDLQYPAGTFDCIVGLGILHHLDARVALDSLYRALKTGGRALFVEPLADNPLLRLFRLLTPSARTKDEKPFTGRDIRELFPASRWVAQISCAGILEAPTSVVTSFLMPANADNFLLRSADRLESWINRKRILPSWNQIVLFDLTKK